MITFSVTASPGLFLSPCSCVLTVTWNDLSSLLSPTPHPPHVWSPCPFASALFSLQLLFYLLLNFFLMTSQWGEDGGPGFGYRCGRARWLCQYTWPAGNSAGSTTTSTSSQSGAPSWEEVPNIVWECLLYVREWSANERVKKIWNRRKTREDLRI